MESCASHNERKEEERSGPYLFPPLQLTKDPLEALVHVVKLGRKANRITSQPSKAPQSHSDEAALAIALVIAREGKCGDSQTNNDLLQHTCDLKNGLIFFCIRQSP